MGFQVAMEYPEGQNNKAADTLSHRPMGQEILFNGIIVSCTLDLETVWNQMELDSYPIIIKAGLLQGSEAYPNDSPQQDQLFYKGCVVLPQHLIMIPKVLEASINSPIGCHGGYLKTYQNFLGWA